MGIQIGDERDARRSPPIGENKEKEGDKQARRHIDQAMSKRARK